MFEIGSEELPPAAAWDAARQLQDAIGPALRAARIAAGKVTSFSTPRRLVVIAADVAPVQEDLVREVRGPAARVAYAPDGSPTPAATGFARSQGATMDHLVRRATPQGEYVYAIQRSPGGATIEALVTTLPAIAAGLTFPKPMRWGPNGVRFARPIRWLLALLGRDIVPFRFAGVSSGRTTYGHRLLSPGPVPVPEAGALESVLRRHHVMLDPEDRRRRIVAAATRAARRVGGRPILDADLLEESIQLVEWPEALAGSFAPEFLELPREVLITVMQHHQKYFAVEDASGRLLPAFVALRNGGTRGQRTVRQGNEWVLRARLADARFFFEEDRKRRLESRLPELEGLIVHEKLGTMAEKTRRLVALAAHFASMLALGREGAPVLDRAARLSKADLVTQMVRELPELQGIIGGIYAALDGEPTPVAAALAEQYLPRGQALPRTDDGAYLALLDKLDTLVSALGAGLVVTGSADPYGLRRAAQGIVSITLARSIRIDMRQLARHAAGQRTEAVSSAMDMLHQRLRTTLIDSGISYDTVDAALASGADDPADAAARARALWNFRRRPEFVSLYTAYDRSARIVPSGFHGDARAEVLHEGAERLLHDTLERLRGRPVAATPSLRPDPSAAVERYEEELHRLADLAGPVDRFFTDVLVMAEDPAVRESRLALLAGVVGLVRPIADLSRVVVGEGKPSGTPQ